MNGDGVEIAAAERELIKIPLAYLAVGATRLLQFIAGHGQHFMGQINAGAAPGAG